MSDDSPFFAPNRPPAASRAARQGEHLWTLTRGAEAFRFELRCHGQWGTEFQMFVNGTFLFGRRYLTREEAMARAEKERTTLMQRGWLPMREEDACHSSWSGVVNES